MEREPVASQSVEKTLRWTLAEIQAESQRESPRGHHIYLLATAALADLEAVRRERDARLETATRALAAEASWWHTARYNVRARNASEVVIPLSHADAHFEHLVEAERAALVGREDNADESFLAGMGRGRAIERAVRREQDGDHQVGSG